MTNPWLELGLQFCGSCCVLLCSSEVTVTQAVQLNRSGAILLCNEELCAYLRWTNWRIGSSSARTNTLKDCWKPFWHTWKTFWRGYWWGY